MALLPSAARYAPWVLRGISYLQLRPPSTPFQLPALPAHIGYTVQDRCALVPGPPLAPVAQWDAAITAFERHAAAAGLAPVFCGVSDLGRQVLERRGYRTLKVGDEAVVHLPELLLRGRRWAEVRAALNRARRRGIAFRWAGGVRDRAALAPALADVAAAWQRRKALPGLRFGLGGPETAKDLDCRLALACDAAGRPLAFATWTPMPQRQGWMLDVMRYRPGVMAGLMDFVIARSLLAFAAEGAAVASLGGVPGSNVGRAAGGPWRWALDRGFALVRWPYNAQGLWHFKAKFNPAWEPLFLAAPPGTSMGVAMVAAARALAPRGNPAALALRAFARSAWLRLTAGGSSPT